MFAEMMRYGTDAAQKGFDDRYFWGHHPMMWGLSNNPSVLWFFSFLWLVTWILVIVILIALARWLWKKGDKAR